MIASGKDDNNQMSQMNDFTEQCYNEPCYNEHYYNELCYKEVPVYKRKYQHHMKPLQIENNLNPCHAE